MATTKNQASRKVLKKLSAVRAVLRKDERDVLDAIVLREVTAHQLNGNTISAAGKGAAKYQVQAHVLTPRGAAKGAGKGAAKYQVQAHGLTPRGAGKVRAKGAGKQQVKAHVIPPRGAGKGRAKGAGKAQVKAHKMTHVPVFNPEPGPVLPDITFDPTLEEYHPIDQ